MDLHGMTESEAKIEQKEFYEPRMARKGRNMHNNYGMSQNGKGDGERSIRDDRFRDNFDKIKGFGKKKLNVIGG